MPDATDNILMWIMIGIFVVNLVQRRHQPASEKKRFATLYMGMLVFALYVPVLTVNEFLLDPRFLLIPAVLVVAIAIYFRKHIFPFRLTCNETGQRLTIQEILFDDSNTHKEPPSESSP